MLKQCPKCNSLNINEIIDNNLVFFLCQDCQNKSGYINSYDNKIVVKKTKDGIKHITAGAMIEKDGKYLLAKRRTFPYRFSFAAGHLEYGETPLNAMKREVLEEVGLVVKKAKLVFHGDIVGNTCRNGAFTHGWYFYKVETTNQQTIINDEFEFINWYSPEEMKTIDLGFATRFLLKKTGILYE